MRGWLLLASILWASPAGAEELHVNRWVSGGIIVVGAPLWYATDAVESWQPRECKLLCEDEVNGFDSGVRDALRWDSADTPNLLSDLSGYGVGPALAFGGLALAAWGDDQLSAGQWFDDALIVGETVVVAGLINRTTSMSLGRARPRTRFSPEDSPQRLRSQAYESFYSGHTSIVFSFGISAATVAYLRGYKAAPWLLGGAIAVGLFTGWMRIAGDNHYATDVLTGVVVGSALGVGIPQLHRLTTSVDVVAAPLPGGGQLVLAGVF